MEIKDLNNLVEELSELKQQKSVLSDEMKKLNERISNVENGISTVLVENNLDSFKTKMGTAYHSMHKSVSILDRDAFFNWLKDKGFYDGLVSVNSQTLKAFVKEQGEEEIPGLKIEDFARLNFRKN